MSMNLFKKSKLLRDDAGVAEFPRGNVAGRHFFSIFNI